MDFTQDVFPINSKKTIEPFKRNVAEIFLLYKTFWMPPFYYPNCKVKMIVREFYHYISTPYFKPPFISNFHFFYSDY